MRCFVGFNKGRDWSGDREEKAPKRRRGEMGGAQTADVSEIGDGKDWLQLGLAIRWRSSVSGSGGGVDRPCRPRGGHRRAIKPPSNVDAYQILRVPNCYIRHDVSCSEWRAVDSSAEVETFQTEPSLPHGLSRCRGWEWRVASAAITDPPVREPRLPHRAHRAHRPGQRRAGVYDVRALSRP